MNFKNRQRRHKVGVRRSSPSRDLSRQITTTAAILGSLINVLFPQRAGAEKPLRTAEAPKSMQDASAPKVPKDAPAAAMKRTEGLRYPLSVGVSFWPFWIKMEDTPPIVEVGFGIRRRWFELDLFVATATKDMVDPPGTMFGLGAMVSFYSVRLPWFRLRHGLSLGLITDFEFKRNRDPDISPYPLVAVRAHLACLQFRVFERFWIELAPVTGGFPSLYEVNLRLRYELGRDSKASKSEPNPSAKKKRPWNLFFTLQQGMVWWHAFDPKVVSLTQGSLGFRYAWFEAELGFGSPAWGRFRKKGLYEVFLRVSFHSYRKGRLRLRHTAAFGVLFHNPPFESHTSRPPVHVDFATLDVFLGAGVWLSLAPFTVSALPRYHLSSSLGIRYEVF